MSNTTNFSTRYVISCIVFIILLTGCSSRQILLVEPTTTTKTQMRLYENGKLTQKFSVNIGRAGVAKLGEKREGDGKTPSGEHNISSLFGYDDAKVDMPTIKATPNIVCVDDIKSKYYNQIIDTNNTKRDFDSFEYMKRDDEQYRYGAVIDYNANRQSGMGSCIFIHIKKSENTPTAGCVALDDDDMKWLFYRLKKEMSPIILIAQNTDEFANFLGKFSLDD